MLVDFGIVDEVDVTEVELKVRRAIKARKLYLTQISRKLVKRNYCIFIIIYFPFLLLPYSTATDSEEESEPPSHG